MKNTLLIAGSLAGLVLFGAGCASSPTPQGGSAQTPSAPVAMHGGNCDNEYYPLKKGTKVSYATHYPGHDSTYSWEVTDATDDSATVTYTFSPTLHPTSEITCGADGVRAKTFMDMGAMSGGSVTAKTISSSGSILPKDVHTGSVWTSRYEVETENNMPAAAKLGMKTSHMVVSTTSTAIGEESVTVPAGTFTALKVEAKMLTHMTLGANMPAIDTQTTSISYFVEGKGLVKTETTDSRGGTSGMEATSIIVP